MHPGVSGCSHIVAGITENGAAIVETGWWFLKKCPVDLASDPAKALLETSSREPKRVCADRCAQQGGGRWQPGCPLIGDGQQSVYPY